MHNKKLQQQYALQGEALFSFVVCHRARVNSVTVLVARCSGQYAAADEDDDEDEDTAGCYLARGVLTACSCKLL